MKKYILLSIMSLFTTLINAQPGVVVGSSNSIAINVEVLGVVKEASNSIAINVEVLGVVKGTSNSIAIDFDIITWNGTLWSNGTGATTADNAVINGDYLTAIDGSISAKELIVNEGFSVSIGDGEYIEVNGNLIHNGTSFIVASGGSLFTNGSVAGSNFTFERTTTFDEATGRYSIVGSPVTLANFSVLGGSSIVYGYDETQAYNVSGNKGLDRFKTPAQLSQTELQVGQGYFSAKTGDVNGKITFTGTPNAGTQSVVLTLTDHPVAENAFEGFNLVSNPYPCGIDFSTFMLANSSDIEGAIYLWDDLDSDINRGTNADYVIVNGIGVVNTDSRNAGGAKWDGIRSMQGFFVQAKSGGDLILDFTDAMKVTGNNDDAGFYRQANEQVSFKITLSNEEGKYSETLIGMRDDAKWNKDQFDAVLFNQSGTKIYSQISGDSYAIQGIPALKHLEIPLGINVNEAATFTIQLDEMENVEGYSITLTDHLLNKSIDLSAGESYTFSAAIGQTNGRFSVSLNNTITGIEELTKQNWLTYQNESGNIVLRSNAHEEILSVELISLSGKKNQLKVNQLNTNEWATNQVYVQGLYIIRIITESSEQISKLLLK